MKRKIIHAEKKELRNLIKQVITEQQWVEDGIEG